ncbi:MAG: glycosyltransferase [Bacteroidota bacterium]
MKLYLFTNSFPYGNSETFLFSEIRVFKRISNIELVLVPFDIQGKKREIPESITVDNSLAFLRIKYHERKIFPLLYSLRHIVKGIFHHDIRSLGGLQNVVGFAYHGRMVAKWASSNIEKGDILYTYWFERVTYGLALFKQKNGVTNKLISRSHRYDLYEELRTYGFIPYRNFTLHYLDGLYSISQHGYDYFKSKYPLFKKLYLSRLGVMHKVIDNQIQNTSKTFVSCSSVIPVKRLDLIFESLNRYALNVGEKISWIHFGGGNQMRSLYKIIERRYFNLEIKLMGQTENNKILKFYEEYWIDLFINLSDSEGIPVSIMEAISYGIPVIARDVGGINEIVNKETGLLLKTKPSVESIVKGIDLIIKSSWDRKRVLRFFQSNYLANHNFKAFYKSILPDE